MSELRDAIAQAIEDAIRTRYSTQDWARTEWQAAADAVLVLVEERIASEREDAYAEAYATGNEHGRRDARAEDIAAIEARAPEAERQAHMKAGTGTGLSIALAVVRRLAEASE